MNNKLPRVEDWVSLYGDYLYGYASTRLLDKTSAEDVVQEAFLAAIKAKDKFNGSVEFKFWLKGILRHKIVDHLRKALKEVPSDELTQYDEIPSRLRQLTGTQEWNVDKWGFKPESNFENEEFWETVQSCLSKLKSPMREVYVLKELESTENENICKEFDITPNNLWVLIHRARKLLKGCISKNWLGN